MVNYTEDQIQRAILAVRNGQNRSQAAREFKVPRSTLNDRLRGASTREDRNIHAQTLSPAHEEQLAQWCYVEYAMGNAPSHRQLRIIACRLLALEGKNPTLTSVGRGWIRNFFRRHPTIKTVKRKEIDDARHKGASPAKINAFFDSLADPFIAMIQAQHRHNFDETGLREGKRGTRFVIGALRRRNGRKNRSRVKKDSGVTTWVFIIKCISAKGNTIDPVVIFKKETVQVQWFPSNLHKLRH